MKLRLIQYIIEEMKFLRSINDLNLFFTQKLPFLLPKYTKMYFNHQMVPLSLQLEPTNHCNLNCISCSRDKATRERGFLDFKLFQKIIDDASKIGVRRIILYLHGEPTLHPKIIDMIKYIKSKGLGITLTTNGMLFNKNKIEAILNSGVNSSDYFNFSILGYSKEVHEKIMRNVNHERVLKNLNDFIELRNKHTINGPIIETVFYKMPENAHEESQFIKKWQGIVDHVHHDIEISEQFAKFNTDENSIPLRNITCSNLWEGMTIFWNGDVTICIADLDGKYCIGNLKEKTIKELWNCKELSLIKKMHKDKRFKELPLCANCDWM